MATLLVGQTTAGTQTDFSGNNSTAEFPFVASASGVAATIFCQFKVANPALTNCRLGIYNNAGGTGGTGALLAVANAGSGYTGTGVFSADISASAVNIVSGTTYWLAYWATGEQVDIQGTLATGTGKEDVSANFATPFGVDGNMNVSPVMWVEDSGVGPTITPNYQAFPKFNLRRSN